MMMMGVMIMVMILMEGRRKKLLFLLEDMSLLSFAGEKIRVSSQMLMSHTMYVI